MLVIWGILFTILVCIVAIPVFIFTLEILLSVLPQQRSISDNETQVFRPSVAVLVPAQNEEYVISETLTQIRSQLKETDMLLVVADNCDDGTADLARKTGAVVLERVDLENQGKGFALDYGIQYLAQYAPDVVVIIDADCIIGPGFIDGISSLSILKNRPVQSLYQMQHKNHNATPKQRLAEFAWRIKNHARPLGLNYIGLPCQLMGSGMAIPFKQFKEIAMGSDNLVEDMQLGIDLAAAGYPPLFCQDVQLFSYFPESVHAAENQFRRWQHGHIGMIINRVPAYFIKSIINRDFVLFALVLDILVPPLMLLAILVLLLFFFSGLAMVFLGVNSAFYLSGTTLLMFIITVLVAWVGFGRNILSLREILFLPVQMLKVIPIYLQYIFDRQKKWVKTERD